ncbi:MAG: hypothetical protein GF355_11495, partial [Candidatus Eisenbacteria bacterium]|nr:hypothetical protein [Candidatus Eisenbacteria bacterium]
MIPHLCKEWKETQGVSSCGRDWAVAESFPGDAGRFCITDVGSTTTKAILFRKDQTWSFLRQEAPTTVEKPDEDVGVGVRNALRALEAESETELLKDGVPAVSYLSTSSAGGGLAMVVTGLVREVTSRSAERVALGAGAILLDVVALNDGRSPYEKIQALKELRPDMILLAGGFDGEAISGPVYLAELILEAGLRPKLSRSAELPVVYAGNARAAELVRQTLDEGFLFHPVPNIRPSHNVENLEPARNAIHDLFMGHVMSQAPGYEALTSWVDSPVLPTPAAFGKILALASREWKARILAIDIGGATTDVFSAEGGRVQRTVSANLGMSYSILNVIKTAGIEAVEELLPVDVGRRTLWDRIGNKYLRPTLLPSNEEETAIERAVAAVAIREAVREHLRVLTGFTLSRSKEELAIRNRFLRSQRGKKETASASFALRGYDVVIGSGGILSHSPRDAAAAMLCLALSPREAVELAVDSAFMFPHLGVLSDLAPELALQLFHELGLVRLERPRPAALQAEGQPGVVRPERTREGAPGDSTGEGSVRTGTIRMRRELAIPGETYVSIGDRVRAESLIARSSRQFLRPFFLDVKRALKAPPEEVPGCLLKTVGDEIASGDVVARRKRALLPPLEFHSNVEGRIERILPSGTLVVREKPEIAAELTAVTAA